MSIGERVKTLRKRLGLTQKEFTAKIPGKGDHTYIGKIERDDQYPSIKFLKMIGDTFNKPLGYFFQEEGPKTSGRVELRGSRVKTLVCLVNRYRWDLGYFSECDGCKLKKLCDKVKLVVLEDQD